MIKSTALPVRAKETTKAKPTQKKTEIVLETTGNEVHMAIDTRRYRIRGLEKNHSSQQLKVNILANRDELVHLDTLDLFKARSRNSFIKATATELFTDEQVIRHDIGTMLLRLEQLQGGRLRRGQTWFSVFRMNTPPRERRRVKSKAQVAAESCSEDQRKIKGVRSEWH